ncbi:methyltransferase domain-containing protein [Actinophytocola glycyrrhizae]|uniref:Methyltransferase domain-containing protein n=1 Tax=Actinophytocola glycyrrhizae TaxID=2044873 RepID=A0ABV9S3T2_9PSEU
MPIELGDDERAYTSNEAPASFADMLGTAAYRCAAAAMRLGVFGALRDGPLPAAALASAAGVDERGVTILADALVSFGYLTGSAAGYELTPLSDRWLVDSPYTTVELFWQRVMFELWDGLEDSVRTGKPAVDFYAWLADRPETSRQFQSMLDEHARLLAAELAPLIPVPPGPARLLDLGGGHGRYSTALCERHPSLTATVLDYASALGPGGDRVTMVPANYLEADLGTGYDVVLLFNVLHGHPEAGNRALLARVEAALNPGGVVAILEHGRDAPGPADVSFLRTFSLNLFHGQNGEVYALDRIAGWLAGFGEVSTTRLRNSPTQYLITAVAQSRGAG